MKRSARIILKSGKDEAVRRYHPWVFSGAIKKIDGVAVDGDWVEVYSNKDEYLGGGHYQDASIAVRLLVFSPGKVDDVSEQFWVEKIRDAFELRKQLGLTDSPVTNVYRLVYGEGDNLPGLIIDYYNGHLVMQSHSIGMHRQRENIVKALLEVYQDKVHSIYDKSSYTLPSKYGNTSQENGFLYGKTELPVEVSEYDNKFYIDFITGQKTGFYIDQRENRKLLTKYADGKSVLNSFSYSGGFSVYAMKAGAKNVHSLDSSARALDLCEKNIDLNFFSTKSHKNINSDTLEYLSQTDEHYDIIILDPPAFAKHSNVKHKAVQGYKRLNAQAIKKINPGGVIFTFSCSQVVSSTLFKSTIISSALQVGRKARILHQMTHPPDHPVNIYHPEGEYLKGIVLQIQ